MSTDDQTDPRGAQRNRPEHVDAFASTVISLLRDRQVVSTEGLRQFVLDHMGRAILCHKGFDADDLLDELSGYRLAVDTIIDSYVPAAARRLGDEWLADDISFADVTIGALRLQSLVSAASVLTRIDANGLANNLFAMVIVPQNEHHFLGASVVAGQLRRMGCEVAMSFDEDFGSLNARLLVERPDLVLITCARSETLETVTQTVQLVRKALADDLIIALGGAIEASEKVVKAQTGVDIVTNVAAEVVHLCNRHISFKKCNDNGR